MGDSWTYGPKRGRRKGRPGALRRHAKALAIGSAIAVLTASGIGVAAWLITGSGTGSDKIGTLTVPTMTAVASPNADLFPNDTVFTGSLQMNASNPNAVAVFIKSVNVSTATFTVPGTCDAALLSGANLTGLNISVPVGNGVVVVPNAIKLAASAMSSCQGNLVTVTLAPGAISYST